ncbi:MAG: DUF6607 family protein [Candidatus Cyclobacteriaceae bacterium M3_2C_046]
MKFTLILIFSLLATVGLAQKKKKQDLEAIKSMCGCYDVTFNFAETFSPDPDYQFHDNYRSGALEYVFPIEETADKVVLQHLLIIGDSMIIKHWRQDWLYENTDLYVYQKNNTWHYTALEPKEVKGQWTQKVYQVDDGPRYEGSASWVHLDGRHYWESLADAPLPRREFSKRKDYNVMKRRNRHEIKAEGWVHEQDNDKLARSENEVKLIAQEKGINIYQKTDEKRCQLAREWWEDHKTYWADVRWAWDQLFARKTNLGINMKVEGMVLFERLFALGDEVDQDNYHQTRVRSQIREILDMHLKNESELASK